MKIYVQITAIIVILGVISFTACGSDSGDGDTTGDSVINIEAITGVTPPAYGQTPVTTITETAQYTGTVIWSDLPVTFVANAIYTATITLKAKSGFTMNGVAEDFFTVAGATNDTNAADSGVITVVFPATDSVFVMSGTGGIAGNNQSFTKGTLVFNMKYVPGGTFPTGIDDLGGNQTISTPFWMAETEVTYELWYKIYIWATTDSGGGKRTDGGVLYSFTFNSGFEPRAGNDGIPGSETGSQEPVTNVSWRHTIVWCNALTEYYNANNGTEIDLDCVYYTDSGYITPIRIATASTTIKWESGVGTNDGSEDDPYVKSEAKGFRLPGSMERECAARYRGTNTDNVVTGIVLGTDYSDMINKWTKGNSASGATGYAYTTVVNPLDTAGETGPTRSVAWYGINSMSATKQVKVKTANSLGLYDMSGNVGEWCFDWETGYEGYFRKFRDQNYHSFAWSMQVGRNEDSYDPFNEAYDIGFRFTRTE